MNKVDLIFEKQPPQVQKKLMNLLVQYNAIMKYNKNSDQFQVDFLLPFQSQREKKQFLNKFESRSINRSSAKAYKSENKNSSHSGNRKNMKQLENNDYQTLQDNFQVSQESENMSADNIEFACSSNQDAEKNRQEKEQEQQISYDFTLSNENEISHAGRKKSFNARQISSILKNKIVNAVSEIRKMGNPNVKDEDEKIKNNDIKCEQLTVDQNHQRYKKLRTSDEQKDQNKDQQNEIFNFENESKFRINPIQIQMLGQGHEGSLKNKLNPNRNELGSGYYNQKHSQLWIPHSKGKSRIVIENQHDPGHRNIHRYPNSYNQNYVEGKKQEMESSGRYSERSSQIKNQILIEDVEQGTDQQPEGNIYYQRDYDYDKNNSQSRYKSGSNQNDSKYIHTKDSKSNINEQVKNKIYLPDHSPGVHQTQLQNLSHLKQRLTDRYGTRKVGANIRQKYVEFVKKNHQQFGRIYENIRKDLRRNENQLNKSRKQDPILVLEQDLNYSTSEEDRLFKEQIIKDYHKHIIAHNQNMSSEDLVKYFRYLLQHAKNLYIKHLRKGSR